MKVTLISTTKDPVRSMCVAIVTMNQKDPIAYVGKLSEVERQDMIRETLKTRLRGALEFASFEFLIEGVTRAFTHQLVRHRSFHFSQQSMRFFDASSSEFTMPSVSENFRECIGYHVGLTRDLYTNLIDNGCPMEDARSILPTNIQTMIMFGCNYRGLLELAEVRRCYQTQNEFQLVMHAIQNEIHFKVSPFLAEQLVPACKRSGHCEFKSVFDRPCPIEKSLTKKGGESNGKGSNQKKFVVKRRK